MFDKKGQIIIDKEEYEADADELMMTALDAGAEDFSEEKIREAGIEERFYNGDLEECLGRIKAYILKEISENA